jgi:hypothetical protein
MSRDHIDKTRRNVQQKLGSDLAGPFHEFIPHTWVSQILTDLGFQFRHAVFSPLGHALGLYRPGAGPGSIL